MSNQKQKKGPQNTLKTAARLLKYVTGTFKRNL